MIGFYKCHSQGETIKLIEFVISYICQINYEMPLYFFILKS